MQAKARWKGVVLAETERPVLLEGNVYFPPEDVRYEHLARTRAWSLCPWKGVARYYTVRAGAHVSENAAWSYPHPSPLARTIKNHVAFWRGVQIELRGYPADELLTGAVCRGAVAVEAGSDEGLTNVLPPGPASTASCSALPCRYCGQLRNHSVQPLSQAPPFGLPTIVMGSPGTARL